MIRYLFAPLEGITGRQFRELHAACFPGVDCYCMPFLTPTSAHVLTPAQRAELAPGNLERGRLLPQVLTKNAEDFVWFAQTLADLGYDEVNLNLGCPSGTVVSKGKGSGMLRDPDALDRFLDAIFARNPIAVSIKTRIGYAEPAEFARILTVLCRYPVRELTVHPRTTKDRYEGSLHPEAFAEACAAAPFPLCYNGNLFTPASVKNAEEAFPQIRSVMLGRGLLADPSLISRCRGGERSRASILTFHNALCEAYLAVLHPNQAALPKLKELWYWLSLLFPDDGTWKRMRKCSTWSAIYPLTQETLRTKPLLPEADFSRLGYEPFQPDFIRSNHQPI